MPSNVSLTLPCGDFYLTSLEIGNNTPVLGIGYTRSEDLRAVDPGEDAPRADIELENNAKLIGTIELTKGVLP